MLVSGTDGVGTKLVVAMLLDKHDTIGIDCVAMCVNDVVCCGAKPLFFLDYIACGKNYPEKIAEIVKGVAEGCVRSGCALIGGETAEHPGVMPEEEYDLAGLHGRHRRQGQDHRRLEAAGGRRHCRRRVLRRPFERLLARAQGARPDEGEARGLP